MFANTPRHDPMTCINVVVVLVVWPIRYELDDPPLFAHRTSAGRNTGLSANCIHTYNIYTHTHTHTRGASSDIGRLHRNNNTASIVPP